MDIIQHPFSAEDRAALTEAHGTGGDALRSRLEAESRAMWLSHSDSHARSISVLLAMKTYDVVVAGSKGLSMVQQVK